MPFFDNFNISPAEAKKNIARDPHILLVDVRDRNEFAQGHIKGAINIPLSQLAATIDTVAESMDTPIYTYCHSGPRSVNACQILKQLGYTHVRNLGGIMAWPYEIEF
jgi:rhodanese-related sulfurtransferase